MQLSQAYFKKTETFLAENEEKSVKTGDMVIIRALGGGEKKTRDITHRVQVILTSQQIYNLIQPNWELSDSVYWCWPHDIL